MAGHITKLEIQKNNKERVNVYLDDAYALAVRLNVALELKKGQYLDDAEIERLKSQDQRSKAYQRALSFLSYRARSEAEMERYLRDKDYGPEVIVDTIERLTQEGYLDDAAFAQAWVVNRERLKPKSAKALRYELRQKGLDEAAIEAAVAEVDETDAAWRAIENKLRQWQQLDEADFKKKAYSFLSRRGFNYEVTREVVERAWESLSL